MNQKRTYTQEFKRETIELWKSSGKPLAQIAKELGVSDNTVYGWKKSLEEHGEQAFPGSGHQTPLEEENRRLRRENELLRQERDILKKRSCRVATPQRMKILQKWPCAILCWRESLRSRPRQWSYKPVKKAG